ncbi:MAG TPA: isoaspartyl peptidase/L-asparaginase, partial [Acidimicrobiales bacterium]|nr:isoaspartyl peptidase/L-asparaginase [Acidimicrobiales bacterium]
MGAKDGALLVASANGDVGMAEGWAVLAAGGSALDAVEAATKPVEANPDDHTVGLGGWPNLLGEVELDASIMDGTLRRVGAVGALKGFLHPISVARAVMDRLPHVTLAGDGAARFAREIGLAEVELLTEKAEAVWRDGLAGKGLDDEVARGMLSVVAALATDPERAAGTVNFLARDRQGHIASAVSTSGWAWKHPGRLGDTPIIGAGSYADDRFGAAACTGYGELAIRSGTARRIIAGLENGVGLEEACASAIRDLGSLGVPREHIIMHSIAIDASGNHTAVTTRRGGAEYVWQAEGMQDHQRSPR